MEHYNHILDLLEDGSNVSVIYIDFAKAFDKVDHQVTLTKLRKLWITGMVGRWIHSFLINRTEQVLVHGSRSSERKVKSVGPQGSVLGPLLFFILIGDIDQDTAGAFLSSFAGDTRIRSKVTSPEDAKALQSELDMIYQWTRDNNMVLNGDKFECLRYGPNKQFQSDT